MNIKYKDYIHLHFIILLWGFTVILGLLISLSAMEVVFYRTLFAAIGLAALILVRQRSFKIGWGAVGGIVLVGFLIALHWILFFGAAKVSNASVCLAGIATAAFWTSIIDPLIFKKPYRWYESIIGLMVVAGLIIILGVNFSYLNGLLMAMASALLASIFTIINGHLVKRYNHYTISLYQMIGACLTTGIFLSLYPHFFPSAPSVDLSLDLADFGWLLVLSLFCTVYAFSASIKVMRSLSAYIVNLSVNMEPIYGMILAILVFPEKEKMEPGFYAGALVIISSLLLYPVLLKWDKKRKVRKAGRLASEEEKS